MAINDTYRVAIIGHVAEQDIVNVVHFQQVTPVFGGSSEESLANAWVEDVQGTYLDACNSLYTLDKLLVQNVDGVTSAYEKIINAAGSITGDLYAFQCAPVISWRTGLTGRSNRGRSYMPPVAEADVSGGGILGGTFVTKLQAYVTATLQVTESVLGGTFNLVVYSRKNSTSNPVTGGLVRTIIGTQRGRRANQIVV